ncbi:MAG: hypothetical protein E6I89_16670 [Chloroflexi bacterium]|nr:MAG: hypothetical protein E6I89_16670 [Chloroflexota bacterium]
MHFFQTFIDSERWLFETRDSNRFHVAFREVSLYRSFLTIVRSRADVVGAEAERSHLELSESLRGGAGAVSAESEVLMERVGDLNVNLRLEIESFHLFANILMDRSAAAIGFYFLGAPSRAWRSSAWLADRLAELAAQDRAVVPGALVPALQALRQDLSNFRNEHIVHDENLRSVRGTGFRTGEGARLTLVKLYPTGDELLPESRQPESRPLADLERLIDDYLVAVTHLLGMNRERTAFQIDPSRGLAKTT